MAGNGRLIIRLVGNGRQTLSLAVKNEFEAVYFCIVLVLVEVHAGGGQQIGINLEWPNVTTCLNQFPPESDLFH